jgi:hypothetical protein
MFAAQQQHSTRSGIASSSSLFNRGSSQRANNNKTMRKKTMRICPMASIPQQGGNAQPREFLLYRAFSFTLFLLLSRLT